MQAQFGSVVTNSRQALLLMDKREKLKCHLCQAAVVVRGILLICTGCGNAKRSELIFSTDQEYQNLNVRRTTQHIKQKQEKVETKQETVHEHLQSHWVEYLIGYSKWLIQMGKGLHVDVKPVWEAYLLSQQNLQLKSQWTVARQGHELIGPDGSVSSKYIKSEKLYIKEEQDEMDLRSDFEVELQKYEKKRGGDQSSIFEIQVQSRKIRKRKSACKKPSQVRRIIQQPQVKSGRKFSRRGSIGSLNFSCDKKEFIENILNNFCLTEAIYIAVVNLFCERYYFSNKSNLKDQIKKIKNIKSQNADIYKQFNYVYLKKKQLQSLRPFMQQEALFLVDYMKYMHNYEDELQDSIELLKRVKREHTQVSKNMAYIHRKIIKLVGFLNCNQTQTIEKNKFPLDFSLALILLYAAALVQGCPITPRILIEKIKRKQIEFYEGFNHYLEKQLNQYLTFPQHLPNQTYIRKQTKEFIQHYQLQVRGFQRETFNQILVQMIKDLNIKQGLSGIILTMCEYVTWEKEKMSAFDYDRMAAGLILRSMQYYLERYEREARKALIEILENVENYVPIEYNDLEHCDMNHLMQHLSSEQNFGWYYLNSKQNQKINQTTKNLSYYYEQFIPLQADVAEAIHVQKLRKEIQNEVIGTELDYLLNQLCLKLDEDKHAILQYFMML